MSTALPIPPSGVELIDRTSRNVSPQWQNYFQQLVTAVLAAGGAPSNAAYWTSTADATLTNERNMALLGGGYLKQTVGAGVATPSATAKIPVGDLNPYSTGTWTPADGSGAGLGFAVGTANYINIGSLVGIQADFHYPVTADGSNARVSSLPFTAIAADFTLTVITTIGSAVTALVNGGTTNFDFLNTSGARVTNTQLSGATIHVNGVYRT